MSIANVPRLIYAPRASLTIPWLSSTMSRSILDRSGTWPMLTLRDGATSAHVERPDSPIPYCRWHATHLRGCRSTICPAVLYPRRPLPFAYLEMQFTVVGPEGPALQGWG